jgi:hypothetical protein
MTWLLFPSVEASAIRDDRSIVTGAQMMIEEIMTTDKGKMAIITS